MLHFSISVTYYQLKLFSLENIQFTPYSIIYGQIEDLFLQKFHFRNRLFVYRRLLMVDTKSRGYSKFGPVVRGRVLDAVFQHPSQPYNELKGRGCGRGGEVNKLSAALSRSALEPVNESTSSPRRCSSSSFELAAWPFCFLI